MELEPRGGTAPSGPAPAGRVTGGRAVRPGLGRAVAALTVLVLVGSLAGCGGSKSNPYAAGKFTPHFPHFLPKNTLDAKTDVVLTGTAARPALTVDGDGVEVKTPKWSVLVAVSGPVVPGEGLPYQPSSTTCTWTITMSNATGPVPISLAAFNSIDHLGTIYRLTFVEGQPVPPPVIDPGQKVTFQLRGYEAVGEGIMRWAPIDQKIVAMWDYEVEND
jgi:hypothetical protein